MEEKTENPKETGKGNELVATQEPQEGILPTTDKVVEEPQDEFETAQGTQIGTQEELQDVPNSPPSPNNDLDALTKVLGNPADMLKAMGMNEEKLFELAEKQGLLPKRAKRHTVNVKIEIGETTMQNLAALHISAMYYAHNAHNAGVGITPETVAKTVGKPFANAFMRDYFLEPACDEAVEV